jgi:hypothetical protein
MTLNLDLRFACLRLDTCLRNPKIGDRGKCPLLQGT